MQRKNINDSQFQKTDKKLDQETDGDSALGIQRADLQARRAS